MSKKDGGPAFPRPGIWDNAGYWIVDPEEGMSLRDYFAAKAMQALIVSDKYDTWSEDAKKAYEVADAMIAERDK